MIHVRALEVWRPVVGFEGAYEVSNCGGMRALDRVIRTSNGRTWLYPGQPIKPWPHVRAGHRLVNVCGRTRYLHTLVLEAFIGPRPDGMIGLHADDRPWNNHVSNLRWGTSADNAQDCIRNGHNHYMQRETCPRGHVLVAPNLVESDLPRRSCKACARAAAALFKRGEPRSSELMQALSDERFARVMSGR